METKFTYWEIELPRIPQDANDSCPECGTLDMSIDDSHALQIVPNTHLRHTSLASAIQEAKRIASLWPVELLGLGDATYEYMPWHDPKNAPQRVRIPDADNRYREEDRSVSTDVTGTSVTVTIPVEWRRTRIIPEKKEIIGPDGLTYSRIENVVQEITPWALAYYKDYSNHEFSGGREPPDTLVVGTESFRILVKELVLYDDTPEAVSGDTNK